MLDAGVKFCGFRAAESHSIWPKDFECNRKVVRICCGKGAQDGMLVMSEEVVILT